MTGYRDLARNRDFTALWVGQTVSQLGTAISGFVFPLLAYALTQSALAAAVVEFCFLGGLSASLLPAGILADRADRRLIMRTTALIGAAGYGSLVAAGLTGALTIPHLTAVALLTGACEGVFSPAENSAVHTVVETRELPTALAQNQARQHIASLLGGPLGGLLFSVTRWLPFAADTASYLLAWVMIGRIRTDLSPAPTEGAGSRAADDVREGILFIVQRPLFRTLMTYGALANLVVNALFFVAVLRLIKAGFHPVEIGLVSTAAGAAGILGALAAPTIIDRLPTGWLTITVAWSFAPLLVPLVFWNNPVVVGAALFVGLLLNPAGNAGMSSYRMSITPDRLQGRVSSASQFLAMSAMPLAPVIGGLLLTTVGGAWAMGALAVLTALVALVPTLSPHIRSVPRPAQWATHGAPAPAA